MLYLWQFFNKKYDISNLAAEVKEASGEKISHKFAILKLADTLVWSGRIGNIL